MGFAVKGGVDKPVGAGSGGNGPSERCGEASNGQSGHTSGNAPIVAFRLLQWRVH